MTDLRRASPLGGIPCTVLAPLITACATAVETGASSGEHAATARPNVVVLYTDDQGYGDCSSLWPEARVATPHLDSLAREGLTFTDGHSAGSVCTPSRYALLTGRYAWRDHPRGVAGADGPGWFEDGRATLASLLREHGYRTAHFGKWHLGFEVPGTRGDRDWSLPVTDGPLQKGFETFYGLPASMNFGVLTWFDGDRATRPASLWTRKKFPPSEITVAPRAYRMAPPYDERPQSGKDVEVAPDFVDEEALAILTSKAVAWLEKLAHDPEPFFLYVALTSPHLPHCTAPEFRGRSQCGNYGDFLLETDHRIGEILDALDRTGAAGDTLVLVSSDNGPENNYHDWRRLYDHRCSGPFRGGKRDVYEGGHRVPLIVRWPGVVAAGTRCASTVGQVDLFATVAELLGARPREGQAEDSVSFLPALRGEPWSRGEPLVHRSGAWAALRQADWKLIRRPDGALELYDLGRDPGEGSDLAADNSELARELERELNRRLSDSTGRDPSASTSAPARPAR